MAKTYDFDLIVIGSGPAGEKGAAQAAYFGKKVALVERSPYLGGTGINTGTIPSKTLRETALYFSGLKNRGLYGIDYSLKENLSVSDFMHRKELVIENERALVARNLKRHSIELIHGEAAFVNQHTINITSNGSTQKLTAQIVLIATGSRPRQPDNIEFDGTQICDSDSILTIDRIPTSLAVVGGGVIGSEYAGIFSALGTKVTLVSAGDELLPFVDREIAARLQSQLEAIGLNFRFGATVKSVEKNKSSVKLLLSDGTALDSDIALFAAGRLSNIEGLNLEAAGIAVKERGLIEINEHFQTSTNNIYAAGDVIGFPALASVSMEQARVAMVHAFELKYKEAISTHIPLAVYSIPEISMVGITEENCIRKNIAYLVGRSYYDKSPRGQIIGDTSGMLKLLFCPETKKILGVHVIGEQASELVHIGVTAMNLNATIDIFIESVYNYPTLSDSYKYAAYDGLGELHKLRG